MKLLWLSHFVPYPPVGGACQRSFNLIRQVAKSHEISLVAFNLKGEPGPRLQEYANYLRKYCRNVEFWDLPLKWKSARWWAELCVSPLLSHPFSCRAFWSKQVATRWQETLGRQKPDLLHIDSLDLALFISAAPGLRKVLNHHNCESAMAYRRAHLERNLMKRAYVWREARKLAQLESTICHQVEVNLAVSERDAELLRSSDPKIHVHVVENGTDINYFAPAAGLEEPKSLIFAGSLNWYPNLCGLEFFQRWVWPLVKQQCPGVRLYIAGQGPADWLKRWSFSDANVVLVANPRDIRPLVARAAVFVCPILDGGGTRLKILDAMAMGKPVVSTSIGCEGIAVANGENILIADTAQDMAHEILRVLRDDHLRERLGVAGRGLVEDLYSWEQIGPHLEKAYQCALSGASADEEVAPPSRLLKDEQYSRKCPSPAFFHVL